MMTRIIKLTISIIYFSFTKVKSILLRLIGINLRPQCVAIYYHSVFDHQKNNFEKQIKLISKNFKVIKSDYFGELESNGRYIIITFDDGFENVFRNGVPILERYKLPFTIFFVSEYFGKKADWDFPEEHPERYEKIMSIDQMKEIPTNLITVGSHTSDHKKLTKLNKQEVILELTKSRSTLGQITGNSINVIAFPNGLYNSFIIDESINAGYKRVFTIEPDNALKDKNETITGRIDVNCDDHYLEFWLKIHGAYLWLRWVNKLKKIGSSR